MSFSQALVASNNAWTTGGSEDYSFTGDMTLHESSTNGVNPTAGRNIVVVTRRASGTSTDSVELRDGVGGGSSQLAITSTPDSSVSSDAIRFWHFDDIPSGVAAVRIDFTGNSNYWVFVFEIDGGDLTVDDTTTYDSSSFGTSHNQSVTSSTTDGAGIMTVRSNAGTRDYNDDSGGKGTALAATTASHGCAYRDFDAVETDDIGVDFATAGGATLASVVYSIAAAGGGGGANLLTLQGVG